MRPGYIVITDNLGSDNGAGVRAAIGAAGAELRFPPPNAPDLDSIENAFVKLKAPLENAAARAPDMVFV